MIKKILSGEKLEHWQIIALLMMFYDIIVINAAFFLALWFRFDFSFNIPRDYMRAFTLFAPIYTVIAIPVFRKLRLYNSIWRFASFDEMLRVGKATVITGFIHAVGVSVVLSLMYGELRRMPFSYYLLGVLR